MDNLQFSLFLLSLSAMPVLAQRVNQLPADTLAEVGTDVITASDLIERIELMPWQGKDQDLRGDSAKIKALQSIVAERLLAAEALSRAIGRDSLSQLRLRALERAFVRDELYKREVAATVKISPQEINAGLKKYTLQRQVLVLRCSSEESAKELSNRLQHARDVDSVGAAGSQWTLLSRDTVTVTFGMVDESLEAIAYSLAPEHRVSAPYNAESLGWAVVVLMDERTNPACAQQDITSQRSAVQQILRSRKAQVRGMQYMASLLGPRTAETDRGAFRLLAKSMYAIMASDTVGHARQGRYFLAPEEIDGLEDTLCPSLDRLLVSMPGGGLTLGMAIQGFRIEPFSTPSLGRRAFASILNESVKRIVQEEFLSREGYGRNLQNTASVRHDVSAWSDKWLSHMMEQFIAESVEPTEDEEMETLIESANLLNPSCEVNVREILTDSLTKALGYAELLSGGADMADLARRVSRRHGGAERGGESGFFQIQALPELGMRALAADTGRLIGPVHLTDGYSIFKVLGKRQVVGDRYVSLDSLKKLAHPQARSRSRRRAINQFIAGLAEKYGVKLYYDRLQKVEIFKQNMFTRRFLGFGGVINAAPVLSPQWGWVEIYTRAHREVP